MRDRFLRNPFPWLLILFLFSVVIRIPQLNRPLSKHHEFCTAVALRVLQIWDEGGISSYHFNPVMTFTHPADKYINNFASASGKMVDEDGNFYYVSHPPFAYYVPYFAFSLLGIYPGVLSIQIFNLLLHFLSALGVYMIVCHFLKVKWNRDIHLAALTGFVLYLFNPSTMWFQSNTYMSDMAVQPLFIFGVLSALKFFEGEKRNWLAVLLLLIFFMTYTTWLGVFFSASLVLYVLFHWKKLRSPFTLTTLLLGSSLCAVALTAFQYSRIAGWDAYFSEAMGRFEERSGISGGSESILPFITAIIWNYVTSYASLFLFLAVAIFILLVKRHSISKEVRRLAWFSLLPVFMLHVILLNYSVHDFTTLYAALFLSVLPPLVASDWISGKKTILVSCLSFYVILSAAQFYYINRPGEISLSGDHYADMRDAAASIKSQSSADEVVFSIEKAAPEIIYYAHRNVLHVNNADDAKNFLKEHNLTAGVVFTISKDSAKVVARFR